MKLQITIDGKTYVVDVDVLEDDDNLEAQEDAPCRGGSSTAAAHPPNYGGTWDAEGRECRSALMGLVIRVNVEPEQPVAAGQLLMVLEAMKMETNVTAPRAGTVKSVPVAVGDSIKVNQLLIAIG